MKPAILSTLVAAKLMAFALVAIAAVAEVTIRVEPEPARMSALSEPLSGGARRKSEEERG